MAAGEKDGLELEAIRKDHHSWHPCQVSLSSCTSGVNGLIVDFENCDLGDIISTEEEALARLRTRSIPLQAGQCSHIKEGERILAMHKTQLRSLFFDAEVEKICRVRHSLRVHCRCSFGIKWLHPEMKGETMTVSSSSIRKLAGNSIHSHPIVSAFLNSMNPLNNSGITSSVTLIEDVDYKIDIQRLLEEQIDEISKVADAPSKAVSEQIILGVNRVERAGGTQSKAFVASEISSLHEKTHYDKNNFGRPTRGQRILQLETESKDLPLFQPSPEEHFQKRSCLNPLAARAALASLMHELPQNPEISIYHVEKEGYVDTSQSNTPEKHMNVLSLDVTRMFMNSDICIQEKLSVAGNHSSVVASMPITSNPIQIANDTFGEPMLESRSLVSSRRSSLEKSQLMEDSYGAVTLQEKSIPMPAILGDERLNTPTVTTRFTRSVMNRKSDSTASTARVTRSAIPKEMGNEVNKVKLNPSTVDGNLDSPAMTKRLTRLAIQKEMGQSVNMASSTKDRKLNSPKIMTRVTRSAIQKETGKSVNEFNLKSSAKDGTLNSPTITRLTSLAIQIDMEDSICETTPKSSTQNTKLISPSIPARLTRLASRKEMGNSVEEVKLESSTKDGKLSSPAITTRLTRSTSPGKIGNSANDVKLESSTKDMKLNSPTSTIRLTHPASQREIRNAVDEIKIDIATKERKSCSPTTTTRLTRSSLQRETGISMTGIKVESAAKDKKFNESPVTRRLTRSAIQKEMEISVSEVKVDSSSEGRKFDCHAVKRLTRSTIQKEVGYSGKEVELDFSTKNRKLNITPISSRLTRSAIQRELDNSTAKVEKEGKRGKSTQDSRMGDTVDLVTSMSKESKKKRSVSSSFDAEGDAFQGKRKMVKVSSTIIIINDNDENGRISARGEGQKVKKPQLRFSHRLRFLPRTRSQRKSF